MSWCYEDIETDLRYVVVELLIEACPESIWKILTDYEQVTINFPDMTKLMILKDDGEIKTMAQQVKPLPPVPPISYVVDVRETYPSLQWRSDPSVLIKVNRGCINLKPRDDGKKTLVVFAAWAEATLLVPTAIVRYQMKVIIPKVLQTLKRHAESSSMRLRDGGGFCSS